MRDRIVTTFLIPDHFATKGSGAMIAGHRAWNTGLLPGILDARPGPEPRLVLIADPGEPTDQIRAMREALDALEAALAKEKPDV